LLLRYCLRQCLGDLGQCLQGACTSTSAYHFLRPGSWPPQHDNHCPSQVLPGSALASASRATYQSMPCKRSARADAAALPGRLLLPLPLLLLARAPRRPPPLALPLCCGRRPCFCSAWILCHDTSTPVRCSSGCRCSRCACGGACFVTRQPGRTGRPRDRPWARRRAVVEQQRVCCARAPSL